MKKTMTKIFALVLVCAMLIGFVAMIPAYAAENETVQIVGHNVYFDDYLQIMYALDIPADQTVEKIVLSDGISEYAAVPYVDEEGNQINASIDGVEYPAYVADTGVSLQNIDVVVTAEVYVDGAVAVTDEYSVLQYLHKRLVADDATEAKDAMYLSLLETAEKMQVVLNPEVTLHKTSYVKVVDGTVDGAKSEAMVAVGATLSGVECDLTPGENQEVVWTVTEYDDAGVAGASAEKTTAEVQAIVIENGVNLKLEAALKDVGAEEPDVIANGNFIIAVNHNKKYIAMDAALNDKDRIDSVEVNVFNGAVTTDGAPEWTVTNVTGGVTLHNGSQYLGQKTANEAYFVLSDEPVVWTVAKGENGEIYLNSTLANETERGILYNTTSSLNQFGVYATTNGDNSAYARAMLFMVYEACEHTGTLVNVVAATCGEAGYSGDTVCSICGALMAPGETLEATGEHTFVEGTCTVCGESEGTASGPVTVSVTMADQGWSNGVKYTTLALDGNITASVTDGTNTGKYYTSDSTWRIYQNESPTLTISATTGTIKSVKITYLVSKGGTLTLNSGNVTSDTVVTVNAASITFNVGNTGTATNGQVKITAIEVVYETGASAASLSNYATAPYDWRKWF